MMKKYADIKRSERSFKVGDWVYVKIQPYRHVTVQGRSSSKLSPKYYGPFEITTKLGAAVYELNLPKGIQIHPVFHVSQLRERVDTGQAVTPVLPLVYPLQQSKEEPEDILGIRMIKRKNEVVPQILIKWLNKDVEEASWEDYEDVKKRFPALILRDKDEFEKEGVSAPTQLELLTVEMVDLVNVEERKKKRAGRNGQPEFNYSLRL